jgi:hypothetical protein
MKYVYYALLLAGLLILLIRWKKIDRRLYIFLPLYLFTIATEIFSDARQVYFLYHINQSVGCLLFCIYYASLFSRPFVKRLVAICFLIYLGYFIYYFTRYPDNFFAFDPIDFVIEGVFITAFSLYYLVDLYRNSSGIAISQHPHFWIVTGNLLFYSGSAFFMGFAFYLARNNRVLYTQMSYIVYFLNLMIYSLYIKAFLCRSPVNKSS